MIEEAQSKKTEVSSSPTEVPNGTENKGSILNSSDWVTSICHCQHHRAPVWNSKREDKVVNKKVKKKKSPLSALTYSLLQQQLALHMHSKQNTRLPQWISHTEKTDTAKT